MELEKLNKSQIVLLTLLVSFMTSIVTGIVTVSLMEQAPPAVVETVNRVVEHTVERVVQGQSAAAAPAIPVVIRESSLIPQAVDTVSQSVVRIYSADAEAPTFLALGVVVNDLGRIVTDADAITAGNVTVELPGNIRVLGSVLSQNATTGVAFIATATSTSDGTPVAWKPAKIAGANPMLGETAILVSGKTGSRIGEGIIAAITPLSDENKDWGSVLETDLSKDGILFGSPIIDTNGSVLGISTGASRAADDSGFLSSTAFSAGLTKETGTPAQ